MQKVLALGFFDGVHLGHGALLRRTKAIAEANNAEAAVLTFDRNPGKEGKLLTSVYDRVSLIRRLYGIENVLCLPFDDALRHTKWDSFLQTLVQTQNPVSMVCGYDYRFGNKGEGTPKLLQQYCEQHGIDCQIVERVEQNGTTVSATLLRKLIAEAKLEQAASYYGHPHVLSGEVVSGKQLGRQLGSPTANIAYEQGILLPPNGVYAVKVRIDEKSYTGVCNIGKRPTVDGKTHAVEVWIPGQSFALYGKILQLEFYTKLRDERKFPSMQELQREISKNAQQAEEYFSGKGE